MSCFISHSSITCLVTLFFMCLLQTRCAPIIAVHHDLPTPISGPSPAHHPPLLPIPPVLSDTRPDPPNLWTIARILSLPELRAADATYARLGNICVLLFVQLLSKCLAMRIPAIAENPYTSWARLMPGMLHMRSKNNVGFSRTDFCCCGTPRQKSTGFLCTFIRTLSFAVRCTGKQSSRKLHVVLKDQNSRGNFLTLTCALRNITQKHFAPVSFVLP